MPPGSRRVGEDLDHSFNERQLLPNDNFRARRYVAEYTINPAITHGIDGHVGDVRTGRVWIRCCWTTPPRRVRQPPNPPGTAPPS